jgi:hypothetical protein
MAAQLVLKGVTVAMVSVAGIPELDIVPLDPLHITRLEFKEGSGNFRLKQVLTNVTIHGLGTFQLQNDKWVTTSC